MTARRRTTTPKQGKSQADSPNAALPPVSESLPPHEDPLAHLVNTQPLMSAALPQLAAVKQVDRMLSPDDEADSDLTTPEQLLRVADLARAELAARELARRDFLTFVKRTVPDYDAGWVHEDICRRLQKFIDDVVNKRSPRLILAMPPRLGKSQLASICLPAWALGNYPFLDFIAASYGQSLSEGFSKKIKSLMDTPDYQTTFPETRRNPKDDSIETWSMAPSRKLRRPGTFVAAGRGSGITGKGAMCFPAGTLVMTEIGPLAIETLCRLVDKPRVLSYNHANSSTEYRVVQATLSRTVSTIHTVKTAGGRVISATGNHPFFTEEHGYREAAGLARGDTVYVLTQEAPRLDTVQSMLHGPTQSGCGADVPLVCEGVHEEAPRSGESEASRADGQLLQYRVQSSASRREERAGAEGVHAMRERLHAAYRLVQSMLRGLQGRSHPQGRENTGTPAVPGVPDNVPAKVAQDHNVFAGLRQPNAQQSAARGRERQLQGVGERAVHSAVQAHEAAYQGARSAPVRSMRSDTNVGGASLRREQGQQHARELDNAVQALPYAAPQVCRDTVSTVTEVSGCAVEVYDIQVEGNHNFFAEGILVHNCLVIDDPIADAEEADSKTVKEGLWDWYTSTARSRVAPGGGVLVIQTLWADDDLAGRLMQLMKDEPEADQFEVVLYPALAEEYEYQHRTSREIVKMPSPAEETPDALPPQHTIADYILLRSPGDALHPSRYDAAAYHKIKATLPTRWWSALYQQNPVPDDGAYYKKEWFRYAPLPPLPDRRHWTVNIAWDFAISEKNTNDYTVGSVALHADDDTVLGVDQVRFRSGDADTIVKAMIQLMKKWHVPGTLMRVGVEDGQIWRALSGTLYKALKKERLYHFAGCIEVLRPITDKLARGRALQGRLQTGTFYLVSPSGQASDAPPWCEVMRNEMVRFPAGKHDDICDSWGWNMQMLVGKPAPRPAKKKNEKSWRDKLKKLTADGRAKSFMRA